MAKGQGMGFYCYIVPLCWCCDDVASVLEWIFWGSLVVVNKVCEKSVANVYFNNTSAESRLTYKGGVDC